MFPSAPYDQPFKSLLGGWVMDKGRFVHLAKFLICARSLTSLQVMYAIPQPDETFEAACDRIDNMLHGRWSPPVFFSLPLLRLGWLSSRRKGAPPGFV